MQNYKANLMQLVPSRSDYQVTRNCNFSGQNGQSCQEICNCHNFHFIFTINGHQILTENGVFHISKPIPRSFKLFPQHSCQVVYHRPPKLPGTGNTFSRYFFFFKVVRTL